MRAVAILLIATACATPKQWVKQGASESDFRLESADCKARAFSIPNAPPVQIAIVYNECMQSKGWQTEPKS